MLELNFIHDFRLQCTQFSKYLVTTFPLQNDLNEYNECKKSTYDIQLSIGVKCSK